MRIKPLVGALPLLFIGSIALGGYVQPAQVTVTVNQDLSGTASGDMVTARFAADAVTLIGCGSRTTKAADGTIFRTGFCQATDANGVQGACSTTDPGLLDAMRTTGDFSFIVFNWDVNGECTKIGFSTQSFYIPNFTLNKK
jgi:hypothetical protein